MNKLFIESQPYRIFKGETNSSCYEERCISFANSNDIIVTTDKIDRSYIKYLMEIGLKDYSNIKYFNPSMADQDLATAILKDVKLLDDLRSIAKHGEWEVECYIPDSKIMRITELLDIRLHQPEWFYRDYSSKSSFREFACSIGLPIPNGFILHRNSEPVNDTLEKYKRYVLKVNDSAGGLGVCSYSKENNMKNNYFHQDALVFVVEERIEKKYDGSIQFIYDNEQIDFTINRCFVDQYAYSGFEFPFINCNCDIAHYANIIIEYFRKRGIQNGYFGIDFMIQNDNVIFNDFNPRRTSISYILALMFRIFGKNRVINSAHIVNMQFEIPESLDKSLDSILASLRPLLYGYDHNQHDGLILLNPSLLKHGKINLLSFSFNRSPWYLLEKGASSLGINNIECFAKHNLNC